MPVASAEASDPTTKITAAAMIARRRPTRSERGPPPSAPKTAPSNSDATTICCAVSESWKSSLMNSNAPEMMPVSYPKSSPPRAEMAATT